MSTWIAIAVPATTPLRKKETPAQFLTSHRCFQMPSQSHRERSERERKRERDMDSVRRTLRSVLAFARKTCLRHHLYRRPMHSCGLRLLSAADPRPLPVLLTTAMPTDVHDTVVSDADLRLVSPPEMDAGNSLLLCTESLCSESSNDGGDVGFEEAEKMALVRDKKPRQPSRGEQPRRLPPPLPWLVGRRSRFMKAVRSDGRVTLTEIEILDRPSTVRAIRCDGRLRLELVSAEERDEDELETSSACSDADPEASDREGKPTRCQDEVIRIQTISPERWSRPCVAA